MKASFIVAVGVLSLSLNVQSATEAGVVGKPLLKCGKFQLIVKSESDVIMGSTVNDISYAILDSKNKEVIDVRRIKESSRTVYIGGRSVKTSTRDYEFLEIVSNSQQAFFQIKYSDGDVVQGTKVPCRLAAKGSEL